MTYFCVEVSDERGRIICIESEALSGREIGQSEELTIYRAIGHLCGFLGLHTPEKTEPAPFLPDAEP